MDDKEIQLRVGAARMAVIGDFCLDIYWHADMRRSELSRETPHFPLPIVRERMSAGGAGNVAANLLALQPARVQCLGVFGDDWRGREYKRLLDAMGADTSALFTEAGRFTSTYIKPLKSGLSQVVYEDPRLDFVNSGPISAETEARLMEALAHLECDVLCVCDQLPDGCLTLALRQRLMAMGEAGLTVLVDSREHAGEYRHVIVKPNEMEAARALGLPPTGDLEALKAMAAKLSARGGRPALVTIGERGCLLAEGDAVRHIPAVEVTGEIDICGAGDTFMAAMASALAVGAPLSEAASLGCRAASVVVKKLQMTGTATWNEIPMATPRRPGQP